MDTDVTITGTDNRFNVSYFCCELMVAYIHGEKRRMVYFKILCFELALQG
jgi:hypothetical protein